MRTPLMSGANHATNSRMSYFRLLFFFDFSNARFQMLQFAVVCTKYIVVYDVHCTRVNRAVAQP